MKYGLLADIHESVEFLKPALERFACEQVDRVLVLGDVFEVGNRLAETVSLLTEANAEGVWGNHDFGLCRDPAPHVLARFSAETMAFFGSLRPRLEFEDCLITHVEPWLNHEDIFDLWSFESQEPLKAFELLPHRIMLHGHHHRWSIATPSGKVVWDCFHPFRFSPDERYLIIVGALVDGRCGILDTGEGLLTPIDLRDGD